MSGIKKLSLVVGGLLLVLSIAVFLIYTNLSSLTQRIVEKEIPNLAFSELQVGWNKVQLAGVKYTDESGRVLLRADSISVEPSLMSFFGDTFQVASLRIEKPYVYIQRLRSGEIILPVPQPVGAAAEQSAEAGSESPVEKGEDFAVYVGEILIEGGSGEFVDQSMGRPYAQYKVKDVSVRIQNLNYPQTSARIGVSVSMVIDGPRQGTVQSKGWVDPVANSAEMDLNVGDLYIPHAEPYYRSKDTTAKLADGFLALKLRFKMERGAVFLPGEVTMGDIKFAGKEGKFFGVPVSAVSQYFDEERKPLTIPFEVEGHVDRPDEIRVKVISVIVKKLLAKLGAREVEKVTDKLKEGDVEGAKEEVKKIEEKFKGIFKLR